MRKRHAVAIGIGMQFDRNMQDNASITGTKDNETNVGDKNKVNQEMSGIKVSFTIPMNILFQKESITARMKVTNSTGLKMNIWVVFKLSDFRGEEIYRTMKDYAILSHCYLEQDISFSIPQLSNSGSYLVNMVAWKGEPGTVGAELLKENTMEQRLIIYQEQEDFNELDKNRWLISNKRLGRTKLKPNNVSIVDGNLQICMPKEQLSGGEIESKELFGYGVYEAKMKLPDVPTSITGFFLYTEPDYYYEIDIELYNSRDSKLILTTYAEGELRNQYIQELDFDPTQEFHEYRIDYQKNRLNFYVDDIFIEGWTEGIPDQEMKLLINTWYPSWLEGKKAESKQCLLIDWIRY